VQKRHKSRYICDFSCSAPLQMQTLNFEVNIYVASGPLVDGMVRTCVAP
jgi:hypothetical protein